MNSQYPNIAILIFSRTAKAEAAEKRLLYRDSKKKALSSLMINRTKQVANASGLPTFFYSENLQIGSTFGERFTNAIESIFNKGFETVIALGNDCLAVSKKDILKAAELLETTPSVLGPSTDGGVYLLGIQKQSFQKEAFLNIDWQTEFVFEQLLALNKNIKILITKSDIDTPKDLVKILNSLAFTLKKAILCLLKDNFDALKLSFEPIRSTYLMACKSLRAPPSL